MVPTVQPGDRVQVLAAPSRGPKRGDAVVFLGSTGDYDVLHRYLFKVPFLPYFVHRGDARHARVGLARSDRIIGIAVLESRQPSLRELLAGVALVARRVVRRIDWWHRAGASRRRDVDARRALIARGSLRSLVAHQRRQR